MWRNELTVARFFSENNAPFVVDEAQLAATLNALFPVSDTIDWQKVAAAVALTRRISVISGGPRHRENHHRCETTGGAGADGGDG